MKKIIALAIVLSVVSCSQTPRRTLTNEEKRADFAWLFSQFGENYAPLEYKESRFGFKYEELKASFLERSDAATSNEEFYALMHEFVATFKDAHTSGSFTASSLPGRMEVAYLGFSGDRVGNTFVVKQFLPTFEPSTAYPIKAGMVITALDGVPLVDIAKNEFGKLRNLGNDEATITYNMSRIFNRIASSSKIPASEVAALTLSTGEIVMVPWVKKDYFQFLSEQRTAVLQNKLAALEAENKKNAPTTAPSVQNVTPSLENDLFSMGYNASSGEYVAIPSFFAALDRSQKGFNFLKNFAFIDTAPIWTSQSLKKWLMESQFGRDAFKAELMAQKPAAQSFEDFVKEYFWQAMLQERTLPSQYVRVMEASSYPAYMTPVKVFSADGKPTGFQKYVGYIYLDTFSPFGTEEEVLAQFNATLAKFKEFGVKEIIIDMINNGGGSLVLGSKLAQLLSHKKIVLPGMQFKLSDSWIDEFENGTLYGSSDPEKELARKMLNTLKSDRAKGLKISRSINSEVLMPWGINGNTALADGEFKTILLVNEMCASMCDIFSGIVKDNHLGTVVGLNTMGAGGNVVMHMSAPNSGFIVNQTESLIVRKDGSYVENAGVAPDVVFDTISDVATKFEGARNKALELFSKEAITITPVADAQQKQ